jgi:SnoaL-like domain
MVSLWPRPRPASWRRGFAVAASAARGGGVAVRVDDWAVWPVSRPAWEKVPDRIAAIRVLARSSVRVDLIGRLGLLVDARDWSALEHLFADPVDSDRTSLFGGEPQTNTPAELVGGLQYGLGKLDTTHHLISCQVIDLNAS